MKRKIEYVKVTRSNETGEIKKFVPFSDYEHDSFTVSKDEFEAIIRKQQWNKHSEENPIVIIDDEPIPVKKQKLNSNENAPLIQSTPARSELNSILSQEDLMRIFQLPYDYPQQPSIWDVVPPNQYSSKFFEAEVNLPLANKEPLTILVDDDSSPTTALAEQMDDSKNEFSKRAPVPEESLQDKEATPAPCQHSTSRDISFFQSKRKRNNVSISRHKKNQKILEELGIEDMLPEHYIPSAGDKSHLVYVGKVDLLKSFGGHGLYARQNIPKHTCIGIYTGEEFATKRQYDTYLKKHPNKNNNYAMEVSGKIIDSAIKGNFTRYANFSDTQENAFYRLTKYKRKQVVEVVTKREIPEGQQILIDYNEYKPEMSEKYYFLNPEDNGDSALQFYQDNQIHYELFAISQKIESLKLEQGEFIYTSAVGKLIFENRSLPTNIETPVDLLYLQTNSQQIADFDTVDNFTPLMVACYLGQYENVKNLVQHGANVNRQQHHSGNCPLFLALEGYTAQSETGKKEKYLNIILFLIDSNARIKVHNRKDMTFIHKAIGALSTKDFEALMIFLAKKHNKSFLKSFNYLTEDNLDSFLLCLRIKAMDKAQILLKLHPNFIKEGGCSVGKCENEYTNTIQKIIDTYDAHEKQALLELLELYEAPEEVLAMIGTGVRVLN